MTIAGTDAFAASLADLPVEWTRSTAVDATEVLNDVVEPPAVGTPLSLDGISLADLDVTVDTEPSASDIAAATTGVTPVGPAIADYGSVVVQGDPYGTEPMSLYPERHVAVLSVSDIYETMADALSALGEEIRDGLTSAIVATGPSATADMGELVHGAHGPQTVHVVVLEDR